MSEKKLQHYLPNSAKVSGYTPLQSVWSFATEIYNTYNRIFCISAVFRYKNMSEVLLSPKEGWRRTYVKSVCQGATPWKTGEKGWALSSFLRGMVELLTEGWVSCCLVTLEKLKLLCRCSTPWKTSIPPERKGWSLYRAKTDQVFSTKEGWRR